MCLFASGCNSANQQGRNNVVSNTQSVGDVVSSNIEEENKTEDKTEQTTEQNNQSGGITDNADAVAELIDNKDIEPTAKIVDKSSYNNIDYDLSTMSSTVIYSEVYNMVTDPESYMDKVVKINGYASILDDPNTGNRYYACIVPDATACCAQGIEFILNDDYKKYDEYPSEGETINVVGVFSTYYEGMQRYITLKDSELVAN